MQVTACMLDLQVTVSACQVFRQGRPGGYESYAALAAAVPSVSLDPHVLAIASIVTGDA